jgi:hypothetical protein
MEALVKRYDGILGMKYLCKRYECYLAKTVVKFTLIIIITIVSRLVLVLGRVGWNTLYVC